LNQILRRQTSRSHYGSKVPAVTITVFKYLELKDILIQQDFNFIGKEPNYYTRKELTIELLTISTDNIWEKSLKIPKG
jgi:hypothetical protein